MSDTRKLRAERAANIVAARKLIDTAELEKREFTAEEDAKYKKIMAEVSLQGEKIQREEELQNLETEVRSVAGPQTRQQPGEQAESRAQNGVTEETRASVMQGWLRCGADEDPTDAQVEAAKACGVSLRAKELPIQLRRDYRQVKREVRAMYSTVGADGGYTIPDGFVNNLEVALLTFNNMRQVADVMRTDTGNDLPWPTLNDTSNKGEIIGENEAVNEQKLAFGNVTFKAYKYSSKAILIPYELLNDSAINLATLIGAACGERIGRIQVDHFTTGTGAGQPKGITNSSALGVTATSATTVKADEILDLIHSVDQSYRVGASFMLHDAILLAISKLKDGNGQYIWQPGLSGGIPDRLRGYPYVINQAMDSTVASGKKTMLFGALNKYKVRDAGSIRLVRLNERYAEKDQVAFFAFMRSDGHLLDAGSGPVKHMVH